MLYRVVPAYQDFVLPGENPSQLGEIFMLETALERGQGMAQVVILRRPPGILWIGFLCRAQGGSDGAAKDEQKLCKYRGF